MTVFEAIAEMRRLSKLEKPFAFTFMSYSRSRQTTDGIVEVRRAKLRSRGQNQYNSLAEIMEEYYDLDIAENRRFYHPALMTFNGQKLTLK